MFRRSPTKAGANWSEGAMPPLPPSPSRTNATLCSCCKSAQRPGVSFFTIASRDRAKSRTTSKTPTPATILCPDCFQCAKCKKKFQGGDSCQTHSDGKLYCAKDYRELFGPRCSKCNLPPSKGEGLFNLKLPSPAKSSSSTKNQFGAICANCFSCAHCKVLLRAGQSFQTKNGLLYCIADCRELFAPKCNRCCKAPPEGEGLFQLKASTGGTGSKESSSSAICQACFSCAHCGKALGSGEPYQIKDGLYYCTNDFTQLFAPKCGDCNEPITGKFLDVLGSKRHLNCFKCGACGIVLANGKHFVDEIDGKKTPLCEKDYLERNSPKCEHCHISMQKWLIVQGHQLCRRCHTDIVPCFSCHTLTMKGSKATTSMKATTAPTTGGKSSTTATSTSSSDREVVSDFPLAMDLRDDRHVCPTCHASAIVLDNDAALLLAEVKEVLLELGLEQFRSGGAMDHLVVSLVSRADLKKQVHCRAAVPLGVTLSQTESKWNKCTETATTRVPAPESPALPPPSSKGQGLAAAAPSPRQSKSSSPRSSRAAASAKVAPSTPRGRSPRPAPKAHTHSPNVLKQRPPSPRPARPRTSSQVTRATAAADNRSAVTVTVTEVQVASAVKKEPLKPGYLPSALETTITTTTTTATTYAVSSVGVLRSLPRAQCGAVMAHELGHSLLTLERCDQTKIKPEVVEGLCELFSHLYLKRIAGDAAFKESSKRTVKRDQAQEEAAKFLRLHLKNEDPVYGNGLRGALQAFERLGEHLPSFFEQVKLKKAFPK